MGFQHPEQQAHKLAGMRAAAESPKTPEHLRPHIEKRLAESDWTVVSERDGEDWKVMHEKDALPEKGERIRLRNGIEGKVMFVWPRMNIVRLRTDQGKKISIGFRQLKGATR